MNNWRDILIRPSMSIIQTMQIIDEYASQFAAVVDEKGRLLGTVTDGDIRRGILNGYNLDTEISEIMNAQPKVEIAGKEAAVYQNLMEQNELKQLPIIDSKREIINILFSHSLGVIPKKDNIVVLMAGGLGTRLRPLTNHTPKPMLHIGNKPILEIIMESFKDHGFSNFIISVNYKKEMIKDYFQDGSNFGVNITYIDEDKRMGTAGALSLLKDKPTSPFFVMNGDLLTKVNFEQLLDFHKEAGSVATMCVREYDYQIPFGVVETEEHRFLSIKEKPTHRSFVNAGIYVLSPEVITSIPDNEFYDMPELFEKLVANKMNLSAFPLREYWMDIGRLDDYEKANGEYGEVFK